MPRRGLIGAVVTTATVAALTLALAAPVTGQTFADELWDANRDVYDAILEHPFLRGMQDGSLPLDTFTFYIVQDARYLGVFAEALKAAATKAPDPAWARQLSADAQSSLAEERRLHEQVFSTHGMSDVEAASIASAPSAVAYANHLLATAHTGSFEEAIAALLPCYWIYWEVGKSLQAEGSPNATYQAWIDAYVSPDYAEAVRAIVDMVNATSAGADVETRERMHERFRRSSRYEWMFWDAAYQRQTWPPE
ncbi:MAG: thiaminase II [Vicinamibacterales bacterium]|jgi:thiaminase/transcriptional activator TenA|nr:thiaminase II [Vicinamibacterales bacterium]